VPRRTEVLLKFDIHQLLGEHTHPFAKEISVFHACLAQNIGECHSQLVGHRALFLSSGLGQPR
jgi:hypothetical protein